MAYFKKIKCTYYCDIRSDGKYRIGGLAVQKKRQTDRVVVQHPPPRDQPRRKTHPQNPNKLQRFPPQEQKTVILHPRKIIYRFY